MAFPSYSIEETGEISCTLKNMEGKTFTITSATISLQKPDGTYILDSVAADIDGAKVYYYEVFASSDGYVADTTYDVVITIIFTSDGRSYQEIYADTITITSVDNATYMSNLIKKMRQYIGDEGESVSRGVIGMPDGTRTTFRLHHMYVDQNYLTVSVNGAAVTAFEIEKNIITFDSAPALNAAIVVDYLYYEYSDEILETCIVSAVDYLNDAASLGFGSYNGSSWSTINQDVDSMILTAAVLEFVSMQIVRLPVAISFGDIGARISLRGAGMERQRAIQEIRTMLYSKIDEYRVVGIPVDVIN
jgi:hypothetical protein